MLSPRAALKYLRLKLGRLHARISAANRQFLLKYDIPSGELADALVLAYGRYQELHCRLGSDPGRDSKVERLSDGPREIVLLAFRTAAIALDFQAFWKRYARIYGPPGVRDAAFAIPSPASVIEAGEDQPRPSWAAPVANIERPDPSPGGSRRHVQAGRRYGRRPESLGA